MAILWLEGFESFGLNPGDTQNGLEEKYTGSGDVSAVTLQAGRTGGLAVRRTSTAALKTGSVLLGAEQTLGFAFKRVSGTSSFKIVGLHFNSLPTALWELRSEADGDLALYGQLVLQQTVTGGLPNDGEWHYLYWHYLIAETGYMKVYVDESPTPAISYSGDTRGVSPEGPATQITRFALYGAASNVVDFDDVYVVTGELLQDTVIETLFPVAAGSSTEFTPDSGDNYARVNERPPDDDTSYVESATIGHVDTYDFDELGSTYVNGLQINVHAKSTSGTADMRCLSRSGATEYPAAAPTNVGASYANVRLIFDEDPSTTEPWTTEGVNAAEFGVQVG